MVEIKLPLYADDMMIYTENPKESIKKKTPRYFKWDHQVLWYKYTKLSTSM